MDGQGEAEQQQGPITHASEAALAAGDRRCVRPRTLRTKCGIVGADVRPNRKEQLPRD
jgi:hypothetical protein